MPLLIKHYNIGSQPQQSEDKKINKMNQIRRKNFRRHNGIYRKSRILSKLLELINEFIKVANTTLC